MKSVRAKPKTLRAKASKIMLDDEVRGKIEQFQREFKEGSVPMEYLMPFLILLGIYSYRRGMRMEPEIRIGEE
jgi:hypothetical protein